MRTTRSLAHMAAIALVGVTTPLSAQRPLSPSERQAIAAAVGQVADSVFAAGRRRDLDRLFSFYSPATTVLRDGKPEDWAEHQGGARVYFRTLRSADYRPLEHEIDVLSPTVALWRGRYSFAFTDTAGHVNSGEAALTWVFRREAALWKIVHAHVSDPLPVNR